ncbi:MAG: aminodeoxychorismate lyase [Bacteroidia bacterium]|nr:MAG: aminodeoxychorismate lyase [Bacteroidia bacterium]
MTVNNLADTLASKKIIKHPLVFKMLSKEMHLSSLKPGKYRITNKMSMPAIIRLFKKGLDEKVTVNIHSQIYYYNDLIETLHDKLMITKEQIKTALHQHPELQDEEWMNVLFIRQYKVNWAIEPHNLLDSILHHYHAVWNNERKQLLKKTGLTQKEAMILASIVQNESYIYSEQRKIAGVYINRLKKQMPLQADPTLKYINHKMNANRVYHSDKEINSPYNTYKYKGLPPSTIGAVSIQALNAVLNYESHNYLYFCAKPELNGYSNYSETFQQHLKYARQYQQQLNQLNIK